MTDSENPQSVVQTVPSTRSETALRIVGGIARWTWRVCSILLGLFCLVFIVAGLSQGGHGISTNPEDLVLIVGGALMFGATVLAWWREGLGGLLLFVLMFGFVVADAWKYHKKLSDSWKEAGPIVLPLLILFSWSLHTLNDNKVSRREWYVSLLAAPILVIAMAFSVWAMHRAPFNP